MYRKIVVALLAGCMCLLCACSTEQIAPPDTSKTEPSVYEDSEGNVVYNYNFDGSQAPSAPDKGSLVKREVSEPEFVQKGDGISREEAEKVLDSCSSYRMYLPGRIQDFKKHYNGIVSNDGNNCYSFSFYAEKGSAVMFVGTDVLVSDDGKAVYRLDSTNSYQSVQPGTASEDKTADQMYEGAKIKPVDALLSIFDLDKERLGLTEEIIDYTFEADDELVTKKSVKCYQFTPKISYNGGIQFSSPIYVAADDSGRIFALDKTKNEYVDVEK